MRHRQASQSGVIYCGGKNLKVTGNRIDRDYRYGIQGSCDNQNTLWENNKWDDSEEVL